MDDARRWLVFAYLFPALLLGFGAASLYGAYETQVDPYWCSGNASVVCLDALPFFLLEVFAFTIAAYMGYRAVRRTRRGRRDLWTVRVYWPGVLALGGAVALFAYIGTSFSGRGCTGGPLNVLYGCWDPGVSLLRIALTGFLTAAFMAAVTRVPEWAEKGAASTGPADLDEPPEAADEIRAR